MSTVAVRWAVVEAPSNIALVKYWGKRDEALNLPAAGSLSMTLRDLRTRTRLEWRLDEQGEDAIEVAGRPLDARGRTRALRILDAVRAAAGLRARAVVHSTNDFPTAAGLASSASGMAALALAAVRAAGLDWSLERVSALARLGSGSAARSLHGGFVEWRAGTRADGEDCVAVRLAGPEHWPLRLWAVLCARGPKAVGSTEAMRRTAATSPYHEAWLAQVGRDLPVARAAIARRDFDALAAVAEASALRMHADMLAAHPAVLYWTPATVAALHVVWRARAERGLRAFVTIDAGPHVKIVLPPQPAPGEEALRAELQRVDGVEGIMQTAVGPGARLVEGGER